MRPPLRAIMEPPNARIIAAGRDMSPARRNALVVIVKAVHSLAFLVIQTAIAYIAISGARGKSDRRAAAALGIALGEVAVYAGNGLRCPLTDVAEALGSEHGAVTDIFLPRWLASNIANIYTPLLLVGIGLHVRNLSRRSDVAQDLVR
jgi:hypothetical protein